MPEMRIQVVKPTVISTFAGCGGSSLGYKLAGFHELLAVEWDNNAVETFKANFPKVPVYHAGMVKGVMKQAYLEIVKTLRGCGYKVKGEIMNAMYYNVPQSRQRVIIIGVRNDIDASPSHPKPQTRPAGPQKDTDPTEKWLTDKQQKQAEQHKARHVAKGNGFGFTLLSEKHPSPTWPKTQILQTSPLWSEGGRLRAPSLAEMKRIASYPQEFKFTDYDMAWERIGNSVPPNLMKAIALHIKANILYA